MQHQAFSQTVSLFCVAAPADAALLKQWEAHLLPLKQAGFITFWSEQHLLAGEPRLEQLTTHLDLADGVVLLLSADFFASDECLTLMQRALLRQQENATVVIPLLLRPVEWQESAINTLACLPANGVPVTQWASLDEAFHACVQGLRSQLNLPARSLSSPSHSNSRSNPNRERMLRRLHRSYRDLLAQSLQGISWIELGLTEKPNAIQNTTNLSLRIAQQAERPLPPGMTITQMYEEAEQELLILGEPGAGKSTLLLHLAQHLVTQAAQDETFLLPVILPLSFWAVKRTTLEDWMVEQIAQTYGIPRKVCQQWVQNEQILPLLDGLDEMEEVVRPACIAAINTYHQTHLTPLVVCSRTTEYENAAEKQRLLLQSAVVVRPLSREQTDAALHRSGKVVEALRSALQEQPALQELATTPLMLNVLMMAYQGTSRPIHAPQEKILEQQVWTDYLHRMVERKGDSKRYPLEQTRSWLGWLAREMRAHNQTIFYAEYLQVDWLSPEQQQSFNFFTVWLPAIFIGIFTSAFVGVFLGQVINFASLAQVGLFGGFLGWWLKPDNRFSPNPAKKFFYKKYSHTAVISSVASSLLFGLFCRATIGFSALRIDPFLDAVVGYVWSLSSIIFVVGNGFSGWLLQWLLCHISQSSSGSLMSRKYRSLLPDWLHTVHLHRTLITALILGTGMGLSYWLSVQLGYMQALPVQIKAESAAYAVFIATNNWVSAGLFCGILCGLTSLFIQIIFSNAHRIHYLAERLHWNARHLVTSKHLGASVLVTSTSFLFFGLNSQLSLLGLGIEAFTPKLLSLWWPVTLRSGLSHGLSIGLSYWLLSGLYQGIIQEQIEDLDRRSFNQGIRRSLRNSIFFSLLSSVAIGGTIVGVNFLKAMLPLPLSIAYLEEWMNTWMAPSLSSVVDSAGISIWISIISGMFLVWATIGGLSILQHYVIRLLLARNRTFPWRTQRFLDDATARVLLQRVGGGYSFIHRRLLDYFADTHPPISDRALTPSEAANLVHHTPQFISGALLAEKSTSDQ